MTLVSVFEGLAGDTWERLQDSQTLEVRFGEETITDLVLLELKRAHAPGIAVLQTNKKAESTQGTDWEWWLGSNGSGWLRFAVQAKKFDPSSKRYGALGHKVGDDLQIDLLEKFAAANRAIPFYCLFNFVSTIDTKKSWQCCEDLAVPQFGCTLTPASVIREALDNRGCRTFEWVHSHPRTLPWRCIVKCSRFQKVFDVSATLANRVASVNELFGGEVRIYPKLPPEIDRGRLEGRVAEFSTDFYSDEVGRHPSRVVVVDRGIDGAV
jgi:Family of unknown function (DUF6615)